MSEIIWPKNRVIIEVAEIKGTCPVYKEGDVMIIEEPKLVLNETDAVCVRAMGPLMTHVISAAGGIDPTKVLKTLSIPNPERGIHYTHCPLPGPPYSKYGPVLFRIKVEGVAKK